MVEKEFIDYLKKNYSRNYLFFDEFMDECLYSDYGFFSKGEVRSSKKGDFLTSPEVSDYFGLFISNWIKEINNNENLNILEIGAGTGSLVSQISKNLNRNIFTTELSSNAQKALKEQNINYDNNLDNHYKNNVKIIYMNEVLDNIPCSIGIQNGDKWLEKTIEITKSNELIYGQVEMRKENADWIQRYNFLNNQNNELEIQLNTELFLNDLLNKIHPEYLLIFDYGFEYKDRNKKPYSSLVRTYKEHHLSVDPIDMPTKTDITYDVNFSFIKKYFSEKNFQCEMMYQYEFLDKFGFQDHYENLQNKYTQSNGIEQLKIKSELVGLEAIHDPRGLGGFNCIVAEKV